MLLIREMSAAGPLSFGFFDTCLEGWSADSCRLSVVHPSATGYAGFMAFRADFIIKVETESQMCIGFGVADD